MWQRLVARPGRRALWATAAAAGASAPLGPLGRRERGPLLPAATKIHCETLRSCAAGGTEEFKASYELHEELGRGSAGVVQRVRHVPTGEFRAVKRLPLERRRRGEVEALANLDHPNVVGYFEHFATGEELLVVQELCSGEPLEAFLEKAFGRGLGAGEVTATALRQMLEAVQHCHERGFVHRDLKADNFVFTSKDPSSTLKLVDFGNADRCGRGEYLEGCAGTVDYSPPEALEKGAGFGTPADIWALGAIFFLLLTGEPLIQVEELVIASPEAQAVQAAKKVLDSRYVNLRVQAACSRVPADAGDLLRELLEQNPAKRITAAEALKHSFITANAVAPSSS